MLAFGHDDDALGVRVFHQRVRDLLGDAFLHLRATRVQLHQSGELAQSDDLPVGRDVADMRDAVERQQTGQCASKARVIQRMRKQKDRRRRRSSAHSRPPAEDM